MVIIAMFMVFVPRCGRESAQVGSNNHYYVYPIYLPKARIERYDEMILRRVERVLHKFSLSLSRL